MAEKKETALVVGMTSIVGTLDEKARAFAQIASAASSGLFPAGYDTVQKILAASWFGDGLGVHPTIYMEGIQPVAFGGKTVREPKWEFVNALLRSRLPGFDFTVHEETDEACDIEFFATGRKSQRVRYTMKDAIKQGLAGPSGRNRDGYEKNARKMLFKQNFKAGADRIGADVLAGLPAMSFEQNGDEPKAGLSVAEAIEEELGKAGVVTTVASEPTDVPFEEVPHEQTGEAAPVETPRARLAAALQRFYGPALTTDALPEKVNLVYNAMMKDETGIDPGMKFKHGDVGPAEADRMIAYLEAKMAKRGKERKSEPVEADAPPPAESAEPEPERVVLPDAMDPDVMGAYDALMTTVLRARKLWPTRKFIQESPPKSGKYWFTDMATFSQAGDEGSVKLQLGPIVVAPISKLEQLNKILSAACDARERGPR